MAQNLENTIKLLRQNKALQDMDIELLKTVINVVSDNFILTPHDDLSQKSKAFHNMKFGFFKDAFNDEELEIYTDLWAATWEAWEVLTDEKIGPYEFIEMDHVIMHLLERRRLAIQNKDMKIDINVGSPGWIISQNLEKGIRTISEFWPRKRPALKKKKEITKIEETGSEVEKVQIFIYGDLIMTQAEYDVWYEALENKADVTGHVVSKMVDPATLAGKNASK